MVLIKIVENMLKPDLGLPELSNPHNIVPKGTRSGGPECAKLRIHKKHFICSYI